MVTKLFLIGRSPFADPLACNSIGMLQKSVESNSKDFRIVLMQDAVLVLQPGNLWASSISNLIGQGIAVFGLTEDIAARGITNVLDGVQMLNYNGLIDQIFECEKTCSNL